MSAKEFLKELNGEGVEGELIKTIFISLSTSLLTFFALYYFAGLNRIENLIPKYGFFIFFAILSYALIMLPIRQVRAFKHFPCMTGMMIGMTLGMMSGFLTGFFIAATNGMFWGSVFGMGIGIFLGVWKGKCCGIMGIMEGTMAGFMGGLMGAMTSLMMFNDHLKAAAIISFLICGAILLGLNYMIYKETREAQRHFKEDHSLTIVLSFILTALTLLFMTFGPRSLLLQ